MANTQNLDLVKPLGTDHALVSVLNSNSDKIDAYAGAVNAGLDGLRDGLGILADGNTHAAVTSGQFVYVKNHQTLPEGLYQATTNIAANGTLSTSNLTADPKGGLNTLSEQIGTLNSKTNALQSGKLNCIKKSTSSGNTFTITFDTSGISVYAIVYGRFGYSSGVLSFAIISHSSSGEATVKCFGDQNITVSCSGDVVTVTTSESYASVTVVSANEIS